MFSNQLGLLASRPNQRTSSGQRLDTNMFDLTNYVLDIATLPTWQSHLAQVVGTCTCVCVRAFGACYEHMSQCRTSFKNP